MFGLHLEQGAAVFDGHDLDEIRQIAVPVIENGPRDVRPRVGQVVLDEPLKTLGASRVSVRLHPEVEVEIEEGYPVLVNDADCAAAVARAGEQMAVEV